MSYCEVISIQRNPLALACRMFHVYQDYWFGGNGRVHVYGSLLAFMFAAVGGSVHESMAGPGGPIGPTPITYCTASGSCCNSTNLLGACSAMDIPDVILSSTSSTSSSCTTQGNNTTCLGSQSCSFNDSSCSNMDGRCCLGLGGTPGGVGSAYAGQVGAGCYEFPYEP